MAQLSDIVLKRALVIEWLVGFGHGSGMKHVIASLTLIILMAGSANAACYAEYKAKQDNPLRLHYGVAEIFGDCSVDAAELELPDRLATDGWELLAVMSVFGEEGLDERSANAGDYYLRY